MLLTLSAGQTEYQKVLSYILYGKYEKAAFAMFYKTVK